MNSSSVFFYLQGGSKSWPNDYSVFTVFVIIFSASENDANIELTVEETSICTMPAAVSIYQPFSLDKNIITQIKLQTTIV